MTISMFMRWSPYVGLSILSATLMLWPWVSNYFNHPVQLLGGAMGIITGLALYFDRRIDKISVGEFMQHLPLAQALQHALQMRKTTKTVRIFASTTGQIHPILNSLDFSTETCRILVREMPGASKTAKAFNLRANSLVDQWVEMRADGRIRDLTIKRFDYFPVNYVVIFDRRCVVVGNFVPTDVGPRKVIIGDPYIADDSTEAGSRLIEKYITWYEDIWQTIEPKESA